MNWPNFIIGVVVGYFCAFGSLFACFYLFNKREKDEDDGEYYKPTEMEED